MEEKKVFSPHIAAQPCDIAKTVLMPGDPNRSKYIAENFLENAVMFNNIRGVQGYTGYYKGARVSVMASGMGIPSIGIYSYELYNIFGVENIIRIGSAGSMRADVEIRDIVIGMGACTDTNFGVQYRLPGTFAPIADYGLMSEAVSAAEKLGARYHVGNLLSSDIYYSDDSEANAAWMKMGVLAVEMESAGLYMNAARAGKRALAICTVSNSLLTGVEVPPEERENTFGQMVEVALEVALAYDKK